MRYRAHLHILRLEKKRSSNTVPKAGKSFHRTGQESKQVNTLLIDGVNTSYSSV